MNQRANYQPTSNPYTADLLKPHDDKLKMALEFGTQNTSDTGDAFVTDPGATPTINSINARMGMLEVQANEDIIEPRGTTFLLPEWSEFTENPAVGGARVMCIYAHLLLRDSAVGEEAVALLVLAGEDLIGNAPAVPLSAIAIATAQSMGSDVEGQEANAVALEWVNGGGGGQDVLNSIHQWGTSLYIRLFCLGDTDKETECEVFLSRDGLTWTPAFALEIDESLRRIGLGMLGSGLAWLDWVRVYDYPVTGFSPGGLFLPLAPLTGNRRF